MATGARALIYITLTSPGQGQLPKRAEMITITNVDYSSIKLKTPRLSKLIPIHA